MRHTHRRFTRQAKELGVFETVLCWTERHLEVQFQQNFSEVLDPSIRGFGYFVWKPQIILQALELIPVGDVLLYLDSGSHLVLSGRGRFLEYVDAVTESETGILAFELTHIEREWTKGDLLDFLGVRGNARIVDTPQIQAGAIFVHNRPGVRILFQSWLDVFSQRFDLVDDTPSVSPNFKGFVTHRHDQSVFSIFAKLAGVTLFSALEQYPMGDPPAWDSLAGFPIHHRRDKAKRWEKYASGLKSSILPFEVFLVRAKELFLSMFSFNR